MDNIKKNKNETKWNKMKGKKIFQNYRKKIKLN